MSKALYKTTQSEVKVRRTSIPKGYTRDPPDGGWAWVVLVGCFFAGLNTVGAISTFAVILNDLTTIFSTTTATLSWIPSVGISTGQFLGPVCTVIINKCGCRKATIIGGMLISSGIMLSYFASRVEILIVTYGVITGMGSGLCHASYPVILSQYFKKYFGIAIGCLVSSFAASRLILTPLAQLILDEYGCRATMLLMGILSMHICVGGCLFQPIKWHSVLVPINKDVDSKPSKMKNVNVPKEAKDNDNFAEHEVVTGLLEDKEPKSTEDYYRDKTSNSQSLKYATSIESMNVIFNEDMVKSTTEDSKEVSCIPLLCKKGPCKTIDHSLWKEPLFYIVCLNGVGVLAIMVYSNLFLFPLGIEIGLAPMETASVISAKATADIIGRLVGPSLITLLKLPTRYSFMVLNAVHAIILAAFLVANSYDLFVSLAIVSGVLFGVVIGLNGVLMVECMGVSRLSSVIGLSAFLQAFLMLPMAPTMGWIRDSTGSFKEVFLFMSGLEVVVVILWSLKPLIAKVSK